MLVDEVIELREDIKKNNVERSELGKNGENERRIKRKKIKEENQRGKQN